MIEYPGRDERRLAQDLMAGVVERAPGLLDLRGIPLAPTLEHILFTGLRSGRLPTGAPPMDHPASWTIRSVGRLGYAVLRAGLPGAQVEPGGVLVCIHAPVHAVVFAPVATHLASIGVGPIHLLALKPMRLNELPPIANLATSSQLYQHFNVGWIRPLLGHSTHTLTTLRTVTSDWNRLAGPRGPRLQRLAALGLVGSGLLGARLDTIVRRIRPAVLVAFNESGSWARLAPAVARNLGVPSVDLPHAEAADPWGSVGMGYDAIAVYGPRAAEIMALAGLPAERIVQTGAPRFDRLISAPRIPPADGRRMIVFASQPADPARPGLHPRVKAAALRAAISAAAAVVPATVVVRPHPTETDTVAEETLAATSLPAGVEARIERSRDLHDLLSEAWLLVTVSSQSVFDASAAGVPSMTIRQGEGDFPVTYAAEGISLGITDDASAAEAARRLQDPTWRKAFLDRARRALEARLGPLDGQASERTADLIKAVARGQSRGAPTPPGS